MPHFDAKPALLVLADGTAYRGWSFGATGTAIGEVVFNTGMTGYQEVLTDPSYCGQIVVFTYPELGNTGINPEDEESNQPQVRGAITRNICYRPSNWRSTTSLPDYLKQHNIPGIYGIDTRALTRKIRAFGAMNAGISTEILDEAELLEQVIAAPSMTGLNLVREVTTPTVYEWSDPTTSVWEFNPAAQVGAETFTVVAIDFGIKRNILRRLASYGCHVFVVPANTPPEEILKYNPDGIFLSNGPGDPAAVSEGIKTTKALLSSQKPMFGICMGHQILGHALGAETFKLKFGHRGLNQPAGLEQRVEITSQNHSFAIDPNSLPSAEVEITHLNLNDHTVAGLRHKTLPLFSVQHHPEASPGPHDADYLFEQFVQAMRESKKKKRQRLEIEQDWLFLTGQFLPNGCRQHLKKASILEPRLSGRCSEEGIIAEPLNLTVSLRGTREVRDNYQLFRLAGLLDAFSEPTFRKVISKCIDEGPKHVILDLSQIDFIDSSGLGALVQLAKQAQNAGGTSQIVTNARVTQTVKLVRLEQFLSLRPSVEIALEHVKKS